MNWLYANLGATVKDERPETDPPLQPHDEFRDVAAGVTCVNNCGWFWSRHLELGPGEACRTRFGYDLAEPAGAR